MTDDPPSVGVTTRPIRTGHGWTRVLSASSDPDDRGAVLFLHGVGARADRWVPSMRFAASAGRAAFAVDLPGHGFSDGGSGRGFDMDSMSAFVTEVLDQLGLGRAAIVGTSFGGLVAAHAARRSPGRVESLMLVGPLGFVPLSASTTAVLRSSLLDPSRSTVEMKLRFSVTNQDVIDESFVDDETGFAERSASTGGLEDLCDYLDPPAKVNGELVVEWLGAVAAELPVQVICGRDDIIVDVAGIAAEAAVIPEVGVEWIDDAGHLPYLEQPDRFERLLGEFLARADANSSATT